MAYNPQIKDDMNFSKILFLHMNRILQAAGFDNPLFMSYVDALELTLFPYIDDEYKEKIQKAERKSSLSSITDMFDGADAVKNSARLELTKEKYKQLMCLAKRKKLLLQEDTYGQDEDNN